MDKEKLIASIMRDAESEGEPLTREEAEEVAEMEIKAKAVRHYEKSGAPRKSTTRPHKTDADKLYLVDILAKAIATAITEVNVSNAERSLDFTYHDNSYTVTLTKHRPKK